MGLNEATLVIDWPSVSAGSSEERYIPIPWEGTWRLTKLKFAPATAVAAHASNTVTCTVTKNDGAAGSDSSTIASFHTTTTTGISLALKTTVDMTVTQQTDFTEGEQLKIAKTEAGTGAVLDGTFVAVFEKMN